VSDSDASEDVATEDGGLGPDNSGLDPDTQRQVVRERYAGIATDSGTDDERADSERTDDERADSERVDDADEGCCSSDGCCGDDAGSAGTASADPAARAAQLVGYSGEEIESVDGEANLGLGCGNPQAIASLDPGETVLDLGSGAGFDCFLAAREVGESGQVIGVDMTPEMVEKARENARANDAANVDFRLGEIEHLPVTGGTVDVIVSNCVINLSPDKSQVFREAYRVLRPGGRLAISDVVLTAEPPADLRADPDSVAACVAGASTVERLEAMLDDAGFEDVAIEPKDGSEAFIREWDDEHDPSEFVLSADITGRKPEGENE
jgi:SAM-dependent methyltransferase